VCHDRSTKLAGGPGDGDTLAGGGFGNKIRHSHILAQVGGHRASPG
jgi:hypothetical protein